MKASHHRSRRPVLLGIARAHHRAGSLALGSGRRCRQGRDPLLLRRDRPLRLRRRYGAAPGRSRLRSALASGFWPRRAGARGTVAAPSPCTTRVTGTRLEGLGRVGTVEHGRAVDRSRCGAERAGQERRRALHRRGSDPLDRRRAQALLPAARTPCSRTPAASSPLHLAVARHRAWRQRRLTEAPRSASRGDRDVLLGARRAALRRSASGKTVHECVKADWVRELLLGAA